MREKLKVKSEKLKVTQQVRSLILHPLFSGSAIMILGTNLGNFLAYVYHLIIGRLLGPSSYGDLAASLSALGLLSISFAFLGLVIVKFVSAAAETEKTKLFSWFFRKCFYIAVGMLLILLILAPSIANFLHLPIKITLLFGPTMFFFVLGFFYKSFLQGLLKFKENVITTNADVIFRLFFGVLFVILGFSAFGAVVGIFLGALVSYFIGAYFLKEYKAKSTGGLLPEGKAVLKYTLSVFLISLTTNSFFSSDVILVKHFFSSYQAGIYASLSTLGKIIFYGAGPVSAVMFPLIAQRHSRGLTYKKILTASILVTLGIAGAILTIYWLFPELSVRALYGEKFTAAAQYLIWFGLFMLTFTIANLIISFYLSIEKTSFVFIPPIFALAQVIGIILYHETILEVIKVSLISASFLLVSLLIYLRYERTEAKI